MLRTKYIDWGYVLGLLLLPPVVFALLGLVAWVQGQTRYDPAFFTPEYQERYAFPGAVAVDLEQALKTGDAALLHALTATRAAPPSLQARPQVILALLSSGDEKYLNYLYFDASNYERIVHHIRQVDGRYVVVPEGLYYFYDSGQWKGVFAPLAATWWILVIVFTAGVWFFRYMAETRQRLFGRA